MEMKKQLRTVLSDVLMMIFGEEARYLNISLLCSKRRTFKLLREWQTTDILSNSATFEEYKQASWDDYWNKGVGDQVLGELIPFLVRCEEQLRPLLSLTHIEKLYHTAFKETRLNLASYATLVYFSTKNFEFALRQLLDPFLSADLCSMCIAFAVDAFDLSNWWKVNAGDEEDTFWMRYLLPTPEPLLHLDKFLPFMSHPWHYLHMPRLVVECNREKLGR